VIQLLPSKKDAIAGIIAARTGRMRRKTSGMMEDAGLTQWGVKERGIPGIPAQTVTKQRASSFKYIRTVGLLVEGGGMCKIISVPRTRRAASSKSSRLVHSSSLSSSPFNSNNGLVRMESKP